MASPRIKALREQVANQNPTISVLRAKYYTEAMKQTEAEPMIIRQAKALANVLENIPVRIFPGELVVGAIVEEIPGAMVYPEGVGLRIIPELEDLRTRDPNPFLVSDDVIRILEEEIDPYWLDKSIQAFAEQITPERILNRLYEGAASSFILTEMAGIGHVSINYPKLLSIGFQRIRDMAQEKALQNEKTTASEPESISRTTFYKAAKIAAESIIGFAQRYAKKAQELAKEEQDPKRRAELEEIARNCSWVPANPPQTFWQAIQFIRFIQLALSMETYDGQAISMGRMDQYLLPYYQKDLQQGLLDQEKAIELIESLWIEISSLHPLFDSMVELYFGGLLNTQAVTCGGMDENGEDATNELTYVILEATKRAALPLPNVHLRIHDKSPLALLRKAVEVIVSGTNNIGIFNDEIIVKSLLRKGIPLQEARNYATVGCVELAPFGTSFTSSDAALFNIALCLELALAKGESSALGEKIGLETKSPINFQSMEEIISAFKTQLAHFVEEMAEGSNWFEEANKAIKPTPFLSLCVDDCFEAGQDITAGSARYNFTGVQGVGLADVADSLTALDQLVFTEKKISMEELLKALRTNFKGKKELRQLLVNRAPKYGNDEPLADRYAQLVAQVYSEEVEKHRNVRGGWFIPGMYSVTTHTPFGYMTGALPSGRKAGEPLSNGVSPAAGSGKKGLTAAMCSVASVDYSLYPNGVAYTVTLDPNIVSGLDGQNILASLIQTYCELGGMQIQFNCIDSKTLLEAQKCPAAHKDLVVRVAGYSAYFVDLAKDVQNEIIQRYQQES
ncbi:MAG: formate C-acetyltransferase/glycerol dehydratase family glycyl radical enzyme [Candidatus Hodarchaeota archaeon]